MPTKYKRGTNGYYKTNVWDGTYKDGKKHYIQIRSKKSSRDLEKKVEEYRQKVEERKNLKKSEITFLSYARTWLDVYKAGVADNTREMYVNIIEKHLVALEGIRLQDIERIHLQQVLNNADGKKPTQIKIRMTFKEILDSAVSDRLFPANIAAEIMASVGRVKYKPPEKRALYEYEKAALFRADLREDDKVFVYILYGCGLRLGENVALTVFDFDLRTREIKVSKAHALIRGEVIQKDPKSRNGFRVVPIPNTIFPVVRDYVTRLRQEGKTYLFTMQDGRPLTKSSYDRKWRRIIKAMQAVSKEPITNLTAHIFRHNYCSTLCYQVPKISIKRIAQLMGDTEAVVLQVYNHVMADMEDTHGAIDNAL